MRERTRSDGETKMVNIGNEWDNLLADQFRSEYYRKLRAFLVDEYNRYNVYPPADCIFNALKYTPYSKVKAVLLGQDPYHGPGQAHGLCFSVKRGVMPPPSLKNIFTEIHSDLGIDFDMSVGELTDWARQGVLMLNNAKSKMPLITNPKHAVFTAAHPSPLSAYNGFFGCRHFSKVNEFLKSNGIEPIDWSIH